MKAFVLEKTHLLAEFVVATWIWELRRDYLLIYVCLSIDFLSINIRLTRLWVATWKKLRCTWKTEEKNWMGALKIFHEKKKLLQIVVLLLQTDVYLFSIFLPRSIKTQSKINHVLAFFASWFLRLCVKNQYLLRRESICFKTFLNDLETLI